VYTHHEQAVHPDFDPTHVCSSIDNTRSDGSAFDIPFEQHPANELKLKRDGEDPMVHPLPGHRGSPGRGGGLSWCGVTGASCAATDGDDNGGGDDVQGGEMATSPGSTSPDSASTTVNSDNTKREDVDIAEAAAGTRGRGEGRNPFNWCGVPGMSCLLDAEEEEEEGQENGTANSLNTTTIDLPDKRDDIQHTNDPLIDYSSEQCDPSKETCVHADNRMAIVTVLPTPAPSSKKKKNASSTYVTTVSYHTIIQYDTVVANKVPQPQKLAVSVTPQAVATTTSTATVTELEGSHLLVVADATGPYVIDAHPAMNGGVRSSRRMDFGLVVLMGLVVAGVVGLVRVRCR
jgi:hypothetical protein